MPEILINVINKIPVLSGDVRQITADNSDYTIRFVFDDQWTDAPKTVYFVRQNGFAYPTARTNEDEVAVPVVRGVEVRDWLYIGVQQGDVKTSRPCGIPVYKAITDLITDDAVQPEPSMWEGVILQIAELERLTDEINASYAKLSDIPPSDIFWVTYGTTKYAEIAEAVAAGRLCVLRNINDIAVMVTGRDDPDFFDFVADRYISYRCLYRVTSDDSWITQDYSVLTSYDKSYTLTENSTNNQIPTAKAVYDAILAHGGSGGSESGGILAFMAPGYVPCEDYAAKYYRMPIGDEPEELTIDQLADAYTSSGLTLTLISDNGANGVVRAVLRPAPENPLLETLGFTGEYWVESDVPAEAVPVTPITATIKQDGKITIRLAETKPSVLHLIALGNLPGSTGIVHDTNGVAWTADSLPLAYAERPVELRVIQDPMGTPGSDIYVPPRDGVFRMYNVTGGGSDGTPRAVVFHGHYWGDDLAGWVPAVAVVGEDGRCTVADAAWDGYALKSEIPTSLPASDVYAWAKAPVKPTYTAGEVGALPASTKIPTKTSEITNDSGFITRLVTDLVNYYEKSDTYTKDEINALVSAIPKFTISVVSSLPTANISTTTVYLVGGGSAGDLYTEYIYVNGVWEILGSQRVDLTGYATESWVIGKLGDYLMTDDLQAAIDAALAQAKASGEFDGAPGEKGESGVYVGNEADMPAGTKVRVNPAGRVLKIPVVDDTLTISGQSADAKVTGDRLDEISEAVANKADGIIETATGEALALSDTADAPIRGLVVYGKSTQDGTPTPDTPVPIFSVGKDGEIVLTIEGGEGDTLQTMPIHTPDGLHGIPVSSDGNYTDANGKMWCCDEVDFVKGVRIQRIGVKVFDGTEQFSKSADYQYYSSFKGGQKAYVEYMCDALSGKARDAYNKSKNNSMTITSSSIWVYSDPLCTSGDALETYFAEKYAAGNPVKLYYILETPIETPLTESELAAYAALRTNYPNTTIYADDNAGLAVTYSADTKHYIDKKFAELATAIVNA